MYDSSFCNSFIVSKRSSSPKESKRLAIAFVSGRKNKKYNDGTSAANTPTLMPADSQYLLIPTNQNAKRMIVSTNNAIVNASKNDFNSPSPASFL